MHSSCIRFDAVKQQGICQNRGSYRVKSVRCSWLPSWVSDRPHVAVLRGGHLYV